MKAVILLACLMGSGMVGAFAQRHELDSLQNILYTTPESKRIEVYQEIIIRLWLNHPDSAFHYVHEALRLATKINDIRTKAIATRLYGGVYYYKGNYDSSIKYSYEAYGLSQVLRDSALMSSAMNNVGLSYYNLGSYPEALEFLLRSLNLKTKLKQEYGYAQTLNNVGLVYEALKDYDKARQYFEEAKKVALEKQDKNQELYSLNNIGSTYLEQGDLEKAEVYFKRGLTIASTIDNMIWHATSYSGLAQVYLQKNDITQAKKLFKKSLELRHQVDDKSGITEIYSYYGSIYTKTGQPDSARFFLQKSQAIAKQIQAKDQIILNYDLLKELFITKKQYDSALYFQSQFIALSDSVLNENLARSIKDIQLTIEREESQNQLAAKDYKIRKITLQTYFLIGMVALSIIFLFFLYRSYQESRRLSGDLAKTNREILLQKEEIHSQRDKLALSHAELEKAKEVIHQKNIELSAFNDQLQNTVNIRTRELEHANQELRVVNLELDNFIYRSSHDIRGPLLRLLGICHVAILDVEDEKAKEYLNRLYESAHQLNEIFDRLKIVSHINDINIHPVKINFSEALNKVLQRLKRMEGFDAVEIEQENGIDEWYTDHYLLDLILYNMLENSIRFQKKSTSERKFIRIKTVKNGRYIKMSIIDNGIGVKEPDIENLHKMFSKAAREHGNIGLGLYIVKQCLNKLNGSISLVENKEHLTEFEILHPIKIS